MLNPDRQEKPVNSYARRSDGLLVPAHVNRGAPRVVHCKRERHHVYIGRNPKWMAPSKWGNPFVAGEHGARGECIALYENWLRQNDALLAALDEPRRFVLGCWCAPRACHGDLLLRLANATRPERENWIALAA
ncbi:MAG TPA: DUF4326 domain-containing protein [Solirubrobacteraceae bacterium]|nr:DUF4326 domain-containing protein [Solirubrobacteraceae bacterium]